ncbi:putative DNA topoisomerase III [Fibrobacter succinogenes subsp. succinogenes S85]|uniref:DNA topoisomerase n=1 Tax=Fibrobacter succinogenes (strain ATCC 19169 / S85) TaxID=59374 RepID=C9RKZ2_FIBSS|nr:DNA topoisomerase [Fibrobacter succinogenes]ACX75940.1 DNA topoisomerase type IA central domain protein [Fibrobacter succinogenes subsp. succinogenes S85]ADL25484.1 putative DNA topoisomerase III [Fibrobacter succinogenes subsp. succinogenes S85]
MILLVAEKPSVANQHYKPMLERIEGEKFTQGDGCLIGKNHCITWCVGHLITLAPLDAYPGFEGGWRLSNLPLLPEKFKLMEIESTRKQLGVVRDMMARADVLVNGADAGREGNLIFDLILDYTPDFRKKQIKRLWVNSYVAKDLDKAWKNLEDATERLNLSYAARLRQRADWMVGLNATRAYTLTAGRGKMISVGRVQTPTLNLVVERDAIVEQFKELFYYSVVGTWKGFQAQLVKSETKEEKGDSGTPVDEKVAADKQSNLKVAIFEKEEPAQAVIDKCSPPEEAAIAKVDIQQKKQFPQKPFDLTELQKEGNKRFKYSAQQVLDCAQNLYEKKLLTYPRTDSQYLPDTMQQEAYALAQRLASPQEKSVMRDGNENFVFINSSKVTDHFAIIPTGEEPQNLPEMEENIYKLAKERFVQAWLKPYVWSEMEVLLDAANAEIFRLKLKRNEDLGFRALVKEEKKKPSKKKKGDAGSESGDAKGADSEGKGDGDDITNIVETFPEWNLGDHAPFDSLELQKKKKSKPKYFTEATLLAAMKTAGKQIENEELAEAMKERGLGTPATQAGIIETLKKRGFIEAQKNYLVSTQRGREVIELMDEKVKSPEMTGEWEFKLSQVEKGKLTPIEFRDGIVNYVKELFEHLRQKYGSQFERETVTDAIPCPKCSSPLEIAPWGYVCKNEECGFKAGHTIAGRTLSHAEMRTLLRTGKSDLLSGFKSKKGTTFSATLTLGDDGNIGFEFSDDARAKTPTNYKCPKCGKTLLDSGNRLICEGSDVTTSNNENGDPTLTPDTAPTCDFVFYKTIAGHVMSDEEIAELFNNGTTQIISGFLTKKGTTFNAKVVWDKDFKATFAFENDGHFHGTETKFNCPLCKKKLEENKNAIFCPACNFTLFKSVAGKKLRVADIKALLTGGKTELLTGFKSKKGTEFDAYLKLGEDGRTNFEFVHRDLPCPCCGDQLRFRSGTTTQTPNGEVQTLAAYVCMNPACNYGIPKTFFKREFSDEEVETLLKNKSTPILEPFKKNDTTFRAALELREGGKIAFNKLTVEVIKKC